MKLQIFKQAVILAGGLGTRLMPLTKDNPKPMINVLGSPFMDYQLWFLKNQGIENIHICCGYLGKKIIDYYQTRETGLDITFSYLDSSYLSGSRLKKALPFLQSKFIVMYSDNYCELNLFEIEKSFIINNARLSLTAYANNDNDGEYGPLNNVCISNNIVEAYDQSKENPNLNSVDIGYFFCDRIYIESLINQISDENFSLQDNLLAETIKRRELHGFISSKKYKYITDPNSLNEFEKYVLRKKINHL